jgi:hypothetical protein
MTLQSYEVTQGDDELVTTEGSGGVWSGRVWNATRRVEHGYPQ